LKNLDVGYGYDFTVNTRQLEHFGANDRLLILHPGELAATLTPTIREQVIADLIGELSAKLDGTQPELHVERDLRDHNIKASIALDSIANSCERLPIRSGLISGPPVTGYAPDAMFDRLVGRTRQKAQKGQAVGYAPISGLLVDLSVSELTRELDHPVYRDKFLNILATRLGSVERYDLVAFCDGPAWRRELRLHFLVSGERMPADLPRQLFGAHVP
jgi:hypothetical protein